MGVRDQSDTVVLVEIEVVLVLGETSKLCVSREQRSSAQCCSISISDFRASYRLSMIFQERSTVDIDIGGDGKTERPKDPSKILLTDDVMIVMLYLKQLN